MPSMPPGDPFLVADPQCGFVLTEPRHGAYDVTARGFKGARDWPVPHPPGEFRILVLGDSNSVRLDEPDWPAKLEDVLTSGPAIQRVFVANVSVPGWSSWNASHAAMREIPLFEPDAVIVAVGTNDPYPSALPDALTRGRPDIPNRAVLALERTSRLAAWGLSLTDWRRTPPVGTSPRLTPSETESLVAAALNATSALSRIVVLPHFPAEHIGFHLRPGDPAAYRAAVRAAALAGGAQIVDLSPALDGPERGRFLEEGDEIHLNQAGMRLIAEAVRLALAESTHAPP